MFVAPMARVFRNEAFGYRTITVERPLRDAEGAVVVGTKGKRKGRPQPDAALRDTENVPLAEDVGAYLILSKACSCDRWPVLRMLYRGP